MPEKKLSDIRSVPPADATDEDVDRMVREAEQYLGPVNVTPAMRKAIRGRRVKVVQSGAVSVAANDCSGASVDGGCCTTTLYSDIAARAGCGPNCE